MTTYWSIYPYLNPTIRDVVPALNALIYNYSKNNSNQIKIDPRIEADTFYVENKLTYKAIFDVIDLNKKELQFLNPTIINEVFPKNYLAVLPKNSCSKMYQFCDSMYYYQDSVLFKPAIVKEDSEIVTTEQEEIKYKVKSGDVLGKIAEKYGVKISQLQEWNKLKRTTINVGQHIIIYKKKTTTIKSTSTSKDKEDLPSERGEFITYIVKDGDNLWDIAAKFPNVTAEDIMELNNIDENLKIGQLLKIKKK